jgi:hypothetical protein
MSLLRQLAVAALLLPGCLLDEISSNSRVDPAGAVKVSTGGPTRMTPAVAKAKNEPLTVTGTSPELTFVLTAADAGGGASPRANLMKAGQAVTLTLAAGSPNHLEVHLDGGGCAADSGVVALQLDAQSHLAGSFDVTGLVAAGSTTACHATGTLEAVPIDRGN